MLTPLPGLLVLTQLLASQPVAPPDTQPQRLRCLSYPGLRVAANSFLQAFSRAEWTRDQAAALARVTDSAAMREVFSPTAPDSLSSATLARSRIRWWPRDLQGVFYRGACRLDSLEQKAAPARATASFSLWYHGRPDSTPDRKDEWVRRERILTLQLERPDTAAAWLVTSARITKDALLSYREQVFALAAILVPLQLLLLAAVWGARLIIPLVTGALGIVATGVAAVFSGSPPTGSCLVNLLLFAVFLVLPVAVFGGWWIVIGFGILALFLLMAKVGRWLISLTIISALLLAVVLALSSAATYFDTPLYGAMAAVVQILAGAILLVHREWWRGWIYSELLCVGALLTALIAYAITGWYGGAAGAGILSAAICSLLLTRRAGPLRV